MQTLQVGSPTSPVVLVVALVERRTRDRKVAGSTLQLGQLSLPSLRVGKSSIGLYG